MLDDFKLITLSPLAQITPNFTVFLEGAPRPQPTPLMVVKRILVPHILWFKKKMRSALIFFKTCVPARVF